MEAEDRVRLSRSRVDALCRRAVGRLAAAGVPHDTTHATLRRRRLRAAELVVHGSGWDLGRYVLWPDGSLREVADRLGWVDEESGRVRLRGDAEHVTGAGSAPPAPSGGVWARSLLVPHVDVDGVGSRTEVVVADDGLSRWADHPHLTEGKGRRHPGPTERRTEDWPDLAEDLADRVRRRISDRPRPGGPGTGRA